MKDGQRGKAIDKSSSITRPISLGKKCNADYIRARLERDGLTDELVTVGVEIGSVYSGGCSPE